MSSSRTRHRPHRGDETSNPLVSGDTGTTAGPQGGAKPGPSESGDLQSRQYGVPQADLPGGLNHLVNPQTRPAQTVDKGERPGDYHKYHGVPPTEPDGYVTPPEGIGKAPRPAPVHKSEYDEAVPVRVIEGGRINSLRTSTHDSVLAPVQGSDPVRLCNQDENRIELHLLNEDASTNCRIGSRSELIENRGSMLPAVTNSYLKLLTQSELWVNTVSTTLTAKVSVIQVTQVPATVIGE